MLKEGQGPSAGRRFALFASLAAIAVFVFTYAIIRARASSNAGQAPGAAAFNATPKVDMAPNRGNDHAVNGVRGPSSSDDDDSSRLNASGTDEIIPAPQSSGSRGAPVGPDSQSANQAATRRLKVVARSPPEEVTIGTEMKVKNVTLYEDLAAEAITPPGYLIVDTSYIRVPDHCKYVNHQVALLGRRPWSERDITSDSFTSYEQRIELHSDGEVRALSLNISAMARKELPEGSLIKMRLSVYVHCENGYRGKIDSFAADKNAQSPSG